MTLIISCRDENFDKSLKISSDNADKKTVKVEKTIKNGRFVFSSGESLSSTIKNFEDRDMEKLETEFEEIYDKGFRSHTPLVNPDNEQLQYRLSQERLEKRQFRKLSSAVVNGDAESDEENDEEFIADPLLALLVNGNNEIIVNDTLYKFTKDKGLFFTHVKDSAYLFNYFKQSNNKANINARLAPHSNCHIRIRSAGITMVTDRVSRYIRPIQSRKSCISGGDGGNITSKIFSEEELRDIINGLPECGGKSAFITIFGKRRYCTSYFHRRRRTRIEFWDQNWHFYASIGVLVKTQKRRLGIWWASRSDEIHLGINRVLLRYKYPAPKMTAPTGPALSQPVFLHKDLRSYTNIPRPVDLPFFKIDDQEVLNIYLPLGYSINLNTKDIFSQSNIKRLYKMGIGFLKKNFGGNTRKDFVVINQQNNQEIQVIYFGERYKRTNSSKIRRLFDKDVGFLIGIKLGGGKKPSFSIKPAKHSFRKYTYYNIDFYGMARRGDTWRGSRMVR